MSSFSESDRRIIPRWRDFRTAAELGELGAVRHPALMPEILPDIDEEWRNWKSSRNTHTAGELLSAGLLLGDEDATFAGARFLLSPESNASDLARNIASTVINGGEVENFLHLPTDLNDTVRSVRSLLKLNPFDAVAWAELARFHAIRGKTKMAHRAILTALKLAPENRYILRTASRCLIHLGDLDRAHSILTRSRNTPHDPWVMAAQIAVSSIIGKSSRFRKAGINMEGGDYTPYHLSELRAAIATDEVFTGNSKKAKRFLERAMDDPTENVVAQAWWFRKSLDIPAPVRFIGKPHSFEADTRAAISGRQWMSAVRSGISWLKDEPFSSRPAVVLSYLYSVGFGEHEKAIEVLKASLRANEDDPRLLNNLAFSLASMGKFTEASRLVEIAFSEDPGDDQKIALTATQGLIDFRRGDIDSGRKKYFDAISAANRLRNLRLRTMAYLFLAYEEIRCKSERANECKEDALKLVNDNQDGFVHLMKEVVILGRKKLESVEGSNS